MTLFHTVAFCGHLWQCFKKMANLVHKLNICSFWLETLCQGQKNSEANFCFPRHPRALIFWSWKGIFKVKKSNHFSSGNKSSPQSFSVPGIMFPARRNIYSWQYLSWLILIPALFGRMNKDKRTKKTTLHNRNLILFRFSISSSWDSWVTELFKSLQKNYLL